MERPLLGSDGEHLSAHAQPASFGRRDLYRLLARRAVRHAEGEQSRREAASSRVSQRRPGLGRQGSLPSGGSEPPAPASIGPTYQPRPGDIQIRCFGRFELSRSGVAVRYWRRRSAERLLKFLLVNSRRVHRDVLLDVLWPDAPNKSSIRGLRVTLHALRRAVAQVAPENASFDLIRADGDTYVLNTRGLWIDSDAFDELWAFVRSL